MMKDVCDFEHSAMAEYLDAVDFLFMNEMEATAVLSQLGDDWPLARSRDQGRHVVITRGSRGASLFTDGECFTIPATPADNVFNPTGAGDCFAGTFLGWVATGTDNLSAAQHSSVAATRKTSVQSEQEVRR